MITVEEQTIPSKSIDLIDLLEELYPDKIVTRELSPYEQGKQHGIIDLIRALKADLEFIDEEK